MLGSNGFDLWADGYDKAVGLSDEENTYPFAGYKEVLARIYRTVMQKPGADVLDIGFGTGTLTARLYESGCTISGQDFSEKMIAAASAKMPDAQLVRGDFTEGLAGPLREKNYDFIIATYSLHHLTDEQKASFLRELLGHLREGGTLLIGDVAFETRADLEKCREAAGEGWDDEEFYFAADEMRLTFPETRFEKVSFCAGILSLSRAIRSSDPELRPFRDEDADRVYEIQRAAFRPLYEKYLDPISPYLETKETLLAKYRRDTGYVFLVDGVIAGAVRIRPDGGNPHRIRFRSGGPPGSSQTGDCIAGAHGDREQAC